MGVQISTRPVNSKAQAGSFFHGLAEFAAICKQSALARIMWHPIQNHQIAPSSITRLHAHIATKPAGQKVESSLMLFFTLIVHVTRYCPPATTSPQQAAALRITKLQGNLQQTRPFYSNNSHLILKPLQKLKASRSTHHKLKQVVAASKLAHRLPASWQSNSLPRLSAPSSKPWPFCFGLCWKLRCPY